jgi:hypothetical protein
MNGSVGILTEEQKDALIEHRFNQITEMAKQITDLKEKLEKKEEERLEIWKDYKYFKNKYLFLERDHTKLKNILPLLDEDNPLTLFENGVMLYAKDVKGIKNSRFLNKTVETIYIHDCIDGLCIDLKE